MDFLVVANQTLVEEPLLAMIVHRAEIGPCTFHIVLPSIRPQLDSSRTRSDQEEHEHAAERLEGLLAHLRERGIEATGELGDRRALLAVGEALRDRHCDGIIVSTLPPGGSAWLEEDLPKRLERAHRLPVLHVIADLAYR